MVCVHLSGYVFTKPATVAAGLDWKSSLAVGKIGLRRFDPGKPAQAGFTLGQRPL